MARLDASLAATNHRLASLDNALRLREALDHFEAGPRATWAVIIDRSYTLRDPHLTPKDAKAIRPAPIAGTRVEAQDPRRGDPV